MKTISLNFVEPSVAPVDEPDLVRKVERAYRICYRSEDRMSETSKSLVQRLTDSRAPNRHTSPLEHAWVDIHVDAKCKLGSYEREALDDFVELLNRSRLPFMSHDDGHVIANFRALHDLLIRFTTVDDGEWKTDYDQIAFASRLLNAKYPEVFQHVVKKEGSRYLYVDGCDYDSIAVDEYRQYRTFHVVTTRDVLQELARHRSLSFSVESTRYCNYWRKGYSFVVPRPYEWTDGVDWTDEGLSSRIAGRLEAPVPVPVGFQERTYDGSVHFCQTGVDRVPSTSISMVEGTSGMLDLFLDDCYLTALRYDRALELGASPQEARMLLPGGLKTELMVTGTHEQWTHFLALRNSREAHPQIRVIAEEISKLLRRK